MSRLSIEITPEQHNIIKAMALLNGLNIREYVIKQLFKDSENIKNPNKQLKAAIVEAQKLEKKVKSGKLKAHKSTKSVFDRYR